MHIVLTVGHQNVLAVIPANLIDLDNFTLRNSLMNLSQRLEAVLKRRSMQFEYTVMGSAIHPITAEENDPQTKSIASVVNTIADVIDYARAMGHDVVRFSSVPDIENTVRTLWHLSRQECAEECNVGVHRLRTRERTRLEEMLDSIQERRGITQPEIFW